MKIAKIAGVIIILAVIIYFSYNWLIAKTTPTAASVTTPAETAKAQALGIQTSGFSNTALTSVNRPGDLKF